GGDRLLAEERVAAGASWERCAERGALAEGGSLRVAGHLLALRAGGLAHGSLRGEEAGLQARTEVLPKVRREASDEGQDGGHQDLLRDASSFLEQRDDASAEAQGDGSHRVVGVEVVEAPGHTCPAFAQFPVLLMSIGVGMALTACTEACGVVLASARRAQRAPVAFWKMAA